MGASRSPPEIPPFNGDTYNRCMMGLGRAGGWCRQAIVPSGLFVAYWVAVSD
jgi:hypothetical protein